MNNLMEMRDQIGSLVVLENRLSALKSRASQAETEADVLLEKLKKENHDIEKLESESLSTFVLRLFHQYDNKLEKETNEQIEAKLSYDKATANIDSLKKERLELETRISALRTMEDQYATELNKRKSVISGKLNSPEGQQFQQLNEARRLLVSQKTEVNEAITAANRAKATAARALSELKSAESWATFDAWTRGGVITHMAKYSHIDDAQSLFNCLSSDMKALNKELADVQGLTTVAFGEVSSTQRVIDFWFDNIFTDLSVRSQIEDNMGTLEQLLNKLERVQVLLKRHLDELDDKLNANATQVENLLVSLDV